MTDMLLAGAYSSSPLTESGQVLGTKLYNNQTFIIQFIITAAQL